MPSRFAQLWHMSGCPFLRLSNSPLWAHTALYLPVDSRAFYCRLTSVVLSALKHRCWDPPCAVGKPPATSICRSSARTVGAPWTLAWTRGGGGGPPASSREVILRAGVTGAQCLLRTGAEQSRAAGQSLWCFLCPKKPVSVRGRESQKQEEGMQSHPLFPAISTWRFPTALSEPFPKQCLITQKHPPHRESEAWAGSC